MKQAHTCWSQENKSRHRCMPTYEAIFTLYCLPGWYGGCAVIPEAPLCWQGPSGHSVLKAGPSTNHNINTPALYFTGTYQDSWHRPTDPQLATAAATVLNRSRKCHIIEAMISIVQWQSGCFKRVFFVPQKRLITAAVLGAFPNLILYFIL